MGKNFPNQLEASVEAFHQYMSSGCSKKVEGQDDCLPLALNALCGRIVFSDMAQFIRDGVATTKKKNRNEVLEKYYDTGLVTVNL